MIPTKQIFKEGEQVLIGGLSYVGKIKECYQDWYLVEYSNEDHQWIHATKLRRYNEQRTIKSVK